RRGVTSGGRLLILGGRYYAVNLFMVYELFCFDLHLFTSPYRFGGQLFPEIVVGKAVSEA
ncbi:hypothetical protein PIB30_113329, partial [Stylosanthes scabra]|nr:hypothetical protein [Stylosanthes scabra]